MKITKSQLKQIIKEEIERVLNEEEPDEKVQALKRVYNILKSINEGQYQRESGRYPGRITPALPWLESLLHLVQDRINRVAAGKLEKPPKVIGISIFRTGKRIFKQFMNFITDLGAVAALSENDQNSGFERAKRTLIRDLRRYYNDQYQYQSWYEEHFGEEVEVLLRDLEEAQDQEDILVLQPAFIEVGPVGSTDASARGRKMRAAFKKFRDIASGAFSDEDLVGDMSERLMKAVIIMRMPILEDVYLKDIQKLVLDLWTLTSDPTRVRHTDI